MKMEIFKNVGYDNFELSNLGRVKFLNYRRTGKEKITFGNKCGGEYRSIGACRDGEKKTKYVHILVAEAFIPVPERLKPLIGKKYPSGLPMLEVNHKDENPENNFVWLNEDGTVNPEKSNLEWCTRKENVNYGTRNERAGKAIAKAKTKAKAHTNGKCPKPVLQYSKEGLLIREWISAMEVERQDGFNQGNIRNCCKGKLKSAYGYIWKYKEN